MDKSNKLEYSIILAECSSGQKKKGVEQGIILHNLFNDTVIKNFDKTHILSDKFNYTCGYKLLFELHYEHLNNNLIPIVIGGDHSIGHSTVGSSVQKYKDDILILWIDAHADINTFESSLSKNTHGTPLSGLIGLEKPWLSEITHLLKPTNLIYYGIRDLDKYESDILMKYNIKSVTLTELKELIKMYLYVHISFDVDSIDKLYIDSTGTIADNGITPEEVIECFKICKNKIRAFDIVEFNPLLGDYNKSITTMENIINNII
jgi:arginase